ncbi:aldo/keto reductase [Alteribacillus iranensis]|uniref:Aldo/keto reductase n=1 Tax=Alteribacillus iranensis TaxID=930128 RepID=A0A1I2C3T3_9BACI|nr:aldo/keto reductase [Alteribacillus iranensis]SFE62875.1 Aldo/keto reductase [Alteribacillus iranensis]
METISSSVVTLTNGIEMPWIGLGVYQAEEGKEVETAVKTAIDAGYRSIDTATLYGNEEGVGKAIKDSGVSERELFITTKVWNDDHGFDNTLAAFEKSRRKLGVEQIDLYLIHWPVPGLYKETWRALEELYKEGKVRAIGVSNFMQHHLEDLIKDAEINPMVNQVEFHPRLYQKDLQQYCQNHHIQLEAWRPLGKGDLLNHEVVTRIADKHGKTPAQVLIRWCYENKVVTIPKSVTPERIRSNARIFDFSLDSEDMEAISSINENKRYGYHPDEFPY